MKKKAATPFDLALRYLSYRSRTEAEIRTYLDKKKIDPKTTEEVIQKLKYYGYVDDEKYILSAVQNNLNGNRYGRRRLKNDLRQRGISVILLSGLDDIYTAETEADCLKDQFEKACRKYASEPVMKQKQKINAYLQRRGFSYGQIAGLINTRDFEDGRSEDAVKAGSEDLKRHYEKYLRLYSRKGFAGKELEIRICRGLLSRGYDYDRVKSIMALYAEGSIS